MSAEDDFEVESDDDFEIDHCTRRQKKRIAKKNINLKSLSSSDLYCVAYIFPKEFVDYREAGAKT